MMYYPEDETSQERNARYERERRADSEKAKAAYAEYKADKTKKVIKDGTYTSEGTKYVTYFDRKVETPKELRTHTTQFRIDPDGSYWMWKHTETRQKFLVVNGPLAGQRIPDDRESDYVLFNRNGRDWKNKTPKCVLVHRSSLTETK